MIIYCILNNNDFLGDPPHKYRKFYIFIVMKMKNYLYVKKKNTYIYQISKINIV